MCGRYVLAMRPSDVRRQLQDANMPSEEAPEDDDLRQSYNFAPGYHGLVYRADTPDFGGGKDFGEENEQSSGMKEEEWITPEPLPQQNAHETKYKLQAMKWGLIPSWTKRNPDYGSMLKTINCRDDSLIENRGMWTNMKKKKRCIVVAQGFYEWLKKNNGKEKIPHFTKRKDGQLMCFAGLWDCVKYEDSEENLYTYTIITTNSNKQLNFLHDRMPVIFDNGSDAIKTWLDPDRTEWSKELQSLLKPYDGELECYPVSKEVGKVGNNSPSFIVPINSTENKNNIANFFGNQRKAAKIKEEEILAGKTEEEFMTKGFKVEHDVIETRDITNKQQGSENNALLPTKFSAESQKGIKREQSEAGDDGGTADGAPQQKRRFSAVPGHSNQSPKRSPSRTTGRSKSATMNGTAKKTTPNKKPDGSQKITAFFSK
ncbi:DUF159-domain-containing protein [Lepidopterella palustris CBS 459.81]|uniref:DUF159-domain-containing protein n=1 Tax=Lepidopterella palustris CBS 459.81 TaxID=1314670 RepID=A0A8E2JCI8_9PEZI|nr:DUF159-domain-containing protein [Lepidopterella palustris CBS 459.81]